MNSLVSIVTPCYNSEKFISRYLESVISQSYRPIELILINDGSIDNTEKIINSYLGKLENENIKLIYRYKENGGVCSALNMGFKLFTGDYICWPDPDDYFEPKSIEEKVNILEKNQNIGIVTTKAAVRNIDDLQKVLYYLGDGMDNSNPKQFQNLLRGSSIFCPICHLVKSSVFLKAHPDREIYENRRAANWQILLPIYYITDRAFIEKPLANYTINGNNISLGDNTEEKKINRIIEHYDILMNTINRIDMTDTEKQKYLLFIEKEYNYRKMLDVYKEYKDWGKYKEKLIDGYHKGIIDIKYWCFFLFCKH